MDNNLEDKAQFKKILGGCSKGNRKAQEHLFRNFYSYAMSIALRYCGSEVDAEEITNDSFFKVFTNIEKHDTEKSFKAWLRRIVINTALDHYRANQKNKNLVLVDTIQETIGEEPELVQFDAEIIISQLQKLSPIYRMVFNLYVIEGFTHEEIAAKLNITASTSRSNLARAKHRLRELINQKQVYGKAR